MSPQPFVARGAPGQLVMLALLSLVMIAAAAFLLIDAQGDLFLQVVGIAGVLLFGFALVMAVRQIGEGSAPVIEVRAQGLYWRRWSDRTIPWAAFTRAEVKSIRRQDFLALWLRDPQAYRSTNVFERIARLNRAMGFGDIALSTQATDRRFDELVAAVEAHAPQLFADQSFPNTAS